MNNLAYVFLCFSFVTLSGCTNNAIFTKQEVAAKPGCELPGYQCIKVTRKDTWEKVFPDPDVRHMVKAINRTNSRMSRHKQLYVPTISSLDALHRYSPLPTESDRKKKHIVINIREAAYAAYSEEGKMLRWGPIAAGKDCNRNPNNCLTPKGKFKIYRMHGANCFSTKYPEPDGGAPMPYCMFFNGGIALHGSVLPGYHASHGCVRLLHDDAFWLRHHFAEHGTTVIVE